MTIDPIWWLVASAALLLVAWLVLGASWKVLRLSAWWAVAAVLALTGLSSLQPGRSAEEDSEAPAGLDVVIVVDRTTSMGAEDYDGNRPRMEGVAADLAALVSDLGPACFAVITSDNVATVAVPWTTDARAVVSLASTLGWREESFGNGSDIADAAPLAQELLTASASARPEARRLFLYLGDGEQTSPDPPGSFASIQDQLSAAIVLGYGTEEGGQMRQSPDSEDLVTRNGAVQLSHLDEENLRTIAEQVGGVYEHRSAPGGFSSSLPAPAPAVLGDSGGGASLAWVPAAVALVPVCLATIDAARRYRSARKEARQ